jgi:DNA-binding IclR family transcriptional regulator
LLAALLSDSEYRERFGDLTPELAELRERRYISEANPLIKGVWNISVAIRIPGGYAGLLIPWIGSPDDEEARRSILNAAQRTAAEITAALHLE